MNDYEAFASGAWRGLCLKGYADEFRKLDDWLENSHSRIIRDLPLRRISVHERQNGEIWYVKTLAGLGDFKQALIASLKWRFRPSRALHILNVSRELEAAGFSCPKVLLAARKRPWRPWGKPTDTIIMTAATGRPVSDWLFGKDGGPTLSGDARKEMLRRIGRELARLHNAGFVHGDCHPGNYCWREEDEHFCYIDNDRTTRHASRNDSGACRNLISAGFYLLNRTGRLSKDEWNIVMEEYLRCADLPSNKAAFGNAVQQGLEKRLKKGK